MLRWARATGVAAVLVAMAACSPSSGAPDDSVEPRLPTVVNAPGTWSEDDEIRGPIAAIGIGERTRPQGIFGKLEGLQYFTVSAVDGLATWLPPEAALPDDIALTEAVAVSPDGRWIAWTNSVPREPEADPFGNPFDDRADRWEGWLDGWSVMDTTTGDVQELRDPEFSRVRSMFAELQFSGDSHYLVTTYEPPRKEGTRRTQGHQLVAWDVETGTSVVLEEPAERMMPIVGSAPSGVVWSQGYEVFRADPATGKRTSVTLPEKAAGASWGPGESFAYVELGGSHSLHVGGSVAEAIEREVPLPPDSPVGETLTWQDTTHVVVDRFRTWVDRVDVATGEVERIDLDGYGETFNRPDLATAL